MRRQAPRSSPECLQEGKDSLPLRDSASSTGRTGAWPGESVLGEAELRIAMVEDGVGGQGGRHRRRQSRGTRESINPCGEERESRPTAWATLEGGCLRH